MKKIFRLLIALPVLLISLTLSIWGFKPDGYETRERAISSVELNEVIPPRATPPVAPAPTSSSAPGEPPATSAAPTESASENIPPSSEDRKLTLEYPPAIREGDSGLIRLALDIKELGEIKPTLTLNDNSIPDTPIEIPNLYETHTIVAEARLDMAGMDFQPAETISETLTQGKPALFSWSIRPRGPGNYQGVVWVHLRLIPRNGGEEKRLAISAQTINIGTTNIFGLSGSSARWIGFIGSLIGTLAGIPFIEDIVRWVWSRRRLRMSR